MYIVDRGGIRFNGHNHGEAGHVIREAGHKTGLVVIVCL